MVFQMQFSHNRLSLLYVSDGAYRVLKVAPDELLAQPNLLFDLLVPADAENLRATPSEAVPSAPFVEWKSALDARQATICAGSRSRRARAGWPPARVVWDGIITDVTGEEADRRCASSRRT